MSTCAAATHVPSTTGRLEWAWYQADGGIRRAAVAATLTSWLLAAVLPTSIAVRLSAGVVGVVLVAAALVDVHERRLPNRLLLAAIAAAFVGALCSGDLRVDIATVAGACIAGGAMLVVRLARGVGMGDVKAAAVIGASAASVSLIAAPIAIAVAAFMAAAYGVLARRVRLPLGPALWFGWAVALFGVASGWWS